MKLLVKRDEDLLFYEGIIITRLIFILDNSNSDQKLQQNPYQVLKMKRVWRSERS
jgi:hypothetical protein